MSAGKQKAQVRDFGRFFKRNISHDAQLAIMSELDWGGMLPCVYLSVKSTQLFKLAGWAAQGKILGDEDDNHGLRYHPAYALLAPPCFITAVIYAAIFTPFVIGTGVVGGAIVGVKAIDEAVNSKRM